MHHSYRVNPEKSPQRTNEKINILRKVKNYLSDHNLLYDQAEKELQELEAKTNNQYP